MKHVIRFAVGAGIVAVPCAAVWFFARRATEREFAGVVIGIFAVVVAYFVGTLALDGKTLFGRKF